MAKRSIAHKVVLVVNLIVALACVAMTERPIRNQGVLPAPFM